MRVYFLRHGKATFAHWDRPDDERPLNKKGKKQMKRLGRALKQFKIKPGAILSSPLPRASETAALAARALGLDVREEPMLAPGFDATKLSVLLQEFAGRDLMLVGHEPDLSDAVETLTGGTVVMAPGGLAAVDIYDVAALDGELVWLLTPRLLR